MTTPPDVDMSIDEEVDLSPEGIAPRIKTWRDLSHDKKIALRDAYKTKRRMMMLARWPAPAVLAYALDDSTRNPEHLRLLDEQIVAVEAGEVERLMVIAPPQEGKSQRTSHYGALWMLLMNPDLRIVIASYESEMARRFGQAMRNDVLAYNLGLKLQPDSKAAGRWNIQGHKGSVYCVGVGGALTGRPVDILIIDDPVKDRIQADSEVYRENVWSWWTDVARTRLAPGGRVILVQTRWHADDLAGRLLAHESASDWKVLHIAAQAEPPSKDYPLPDPLKRQVGEYLSSARKWPPGRWEQVKKDVGSRSWEALYQGKPSATAGNIWLRAWWKRYVEPLHTELDDVCYVPDGGVLCQSWDFTFKDTKASDFVVGQVWWKVDAEAFLLDQVRDRLDFPASLAAMAAMTAKWPQATAKLVEDKANGPAIISMVKRAVPGVIPITPKDSKEARASACAPLMEAGNIWVPGEKVSPIGGALIEESAGFPNGSHDDMVDSASQAIAWLYGLGKAKARLIA